MQKSHFQLILLYTFIINTWFRLLRQVIAESSGCHRHKRGLRRRAVSVCLSVRLGVCLSRLCIVSRQVNIFSNFFHRPADTPILVFQYQALWQ